MRLESVLVGLAAIGLLVASFELDRPVLAVLGAVILVVSFWVLGGRRR